MARFTNTKPALINVFDGERFIRIGPGQTEEVEDEKLVARLVKSGDLVKEGSLKGREREEVEGRAAEASSTVKAAANPTEVKTASRTTRD